MKYKIGDKARAIVSDPRVANTIVTITDAEKVMDIQYYIAQDTNGEKWGFSEDELEPVYADGGYVPYRKIPTPEKPISIEEQLGLPRGVSIHDLNPAEWYRPMEIRIDVSDFDAEELKRRLGDIYLDGSVLKEDKPVVKFKNGSSIEALPQKDDTVKGEFSIGGFCDDFRCKIPSDLIISRTEIERTTDLLSKLDIKELEQKLKEEKNLKFTFYTVEGYRMDKSNNTKIPTMTTEVVYKDKDGCATGGSATCDKADYDERQGVIEALANMCCDGNFDREYNKAIKWNRKQDLRNRTCRYCGQVFDTYQERIKHMDWHVECRKARRERYLLRKRAKEIAFEEAAQKMAKEIIAEDNKK